MTTNLTNPRRTLVARGLSLAGRWAMNPQTAMAAVFLLMLGTSAFVLRSRPAGRIDSAHPERLKGVSIVEQGEPRGHVPASDPRESLDNNAAAAAHGAIVPPRVNLGAQGNSDSETAADGTAPSPGDAGTQGSAGVADPNRSPSFATGMREYRARNFQEAASRFAAAEQEGIAEAGLWGARSTRDGAGGCAKAVAKFDSAALATSSTWASNEATLEGARCRMTLGQLERAQAQLERLAETPSHEAEARRALAELRARDASP